MKAKPNWSVSDITNAKNLPVFEFQDNDGEWQYFELLYTPEKIVFGGCCNCGFIESGYILCEEGETLEETLSEMIFDLETYYTDGPEYTNRIIFNERM